MNYEREENGDHITHYVHHFRGQRNDDKFSEINSAFACFAFRVKKKHPRKKHIGKPHADECDSGSFSAMLRRTFGCFRSHDVPYCLREFNVNGGFLAVLTEKWADICNKDPTFGSGYYAAHFDKHFVCSDIFVFVTMHLLQCKNVFLT